MRRIFTVLLLLAIVAAAVWIIRDWRTGTALPSDPWQAVPSHSAIIVSVPDAWNTWDRFTHTSQIWDAFATIPAFAAAGNLMSASVERMQNDAALRSALDDAPMLICLMRDGDQQVGGIFIGRPNGNSASPIDAFSDLMGLDEAAERSIRNGDIVLARPDTALPPLSLCLVDRTWLMATSSAIMDEALLQLRSGNSILQDSLLVRVRGTAGGGADAHVLVHLQRTARLLHNWSNNAVLDELEMPDGWAAMDTRARPNAILMSGLLATRDPDPNLEAMRSQGTGRSPVERMLPMEVTALEIVNITDASRYLEETGKGSTAELNEAIFSWVEGSMGRAWATAIDGRILRWAFFQASDPEYARKALQRMCEGAISCEQNDHRGHLMQRFPVKNALPDVLGEAFSQFDQPWWTIIGDMVIWSPGQEALRMSIDAWLDGNTLAEDARAIAWREKISDRASRSIQCDIGRSERFLRELIKPGKAATFDDLDPFREKLGYFSIQLSPGQHGYHHVVTGLQHAPLERQSTDLLWSLPMENDIHRRPQIVRNHNNNTNEVLVQDDLHRLYLIGSTGRLLWTRQLDGPIMGEVVQVDRYRNGKLQLLFNTTDRIHLIDRNGKDVGGFPISLPQNAVMPITVTDYENDRNYRVLVPTADGRILNYGLDGALVEGWQRPDLGATAASAVRHLRIKNKDYLVIADVQGRLHILDRRGAVRERTALNLGPSPRTVHIAPGSEIMTTTVTWTDTGSAIQRGSFNGPVTLMAGRDTLGNLQLIDVDGDDELEIVRSIADSIMIMNDGRTDLSRSFGIPIDTVISSHVFGEHIVLSLLHPGPGMISLMDELGRAIPGTPIPGRLQPAIGDLNLDGVPEMITMDPSGALVAYSLNGTRIDRNANIAAH